MSLEEYVRAWGPAWAGSRHTPQPVQHDWGFTIETGGIREKRRYVLAARDGVEPVFSLAAQPGSWIKVPWAIAETAAFLAENPRLQKVWKPTEELFFMITPLNADSLLANAKPLPEGYVREILEEAAAIEVRILTESGELAAWGRNGWAPSGFAEKTTVPDQINTEEGHQRKGLASVVMQALCLEAAQRGCNQAILMASAQGKGLYSSLGWRLLSSFTDVQYEAESPA